MTKRRSTGDTAPSVVNSPSHYAITVKAAGGIPVQIEVVDLIEALYPQDAHMAHAMTYVCRAGRKHSSSYLEDLAKARWWITRAIQFHGGHPEV